MPGVRSQRNYSIEELLLSGVDEALDLCGSGHTERCEPGRTQTGEAEDLEGGSGCKRAKADRSS